MTNKIGMTYIKGVARAALPDKLWIFLQKGRRLASEVHTRRHIDLRFARKALLQSGGVSNDEKYLLRNVSLQVHPDDDMYLPGTGRHYLSIGLTSLRCINAALDHAPTQYVQSSTSQAATAGNSGFSKSAFRAQQSTPATSSRRQWNFVDGNSMWKPSSPIRTSRKFCCLARSI